MAGATRAGRAVKEATLRDFFLGTASVDALAADLEGTVERRTSTSSFVHIEDLPADEEFTITAPMLVRLCDAVLTGSLPGPALEPIAFAVIASDHLHWAEGDEVVGRVLYDWASPEVNWELTPENVRMFRSWLTGEAEPPPEPEITPDTFEGGTPIARTEKRWIRPPGEPS
jgi:hypothetical protein